ncbi:serine aminopeptidase domain-containing protein [Aureimonas psammosilenae]|uniref:serine aminopeptidase domain-containing protein n=1 Tax=Aureimonas psammosilenae TaxID=2495496 RepID=UPI0012608A2D|nr:alpha/beta hydrolase [Aureimonas psammosilenae]
MTPETASPNHTPSGIAEHAVSIDGAFGWLHAGHNRRGVIFCGTHGYEQLCAHRAWRELTHRVGQTGCTTLRFDYPGEADSAEPQGARLAAWIVSIRRAIAYLRDVMAVEDVVLVGLRLGGTLAALAAEGEGVDRLVLLAPFSTGRAFLREMKFQARAINLLPDASPMPVEPGPLNVGGFHLDPGLVSDLSTVDLAASDHAPAPHVLVMGGDAIRLAASFGARGAAVETAPFPDLAGLVADPLNATITEETASVVAAYAASGAMARAGLAPVPPSGGVTLAGPTWREEAVRFGPDLFGIECRPLGSGPARARMLFLNLGTIVRSGHGRQVTALARKLAGLGIASLRMDLLGVGDSPERPGGGVPLYDLDALADVRAAIDHLVGQGTGPIVLHGTCNGAYLAFHALCRDERIRGAVLANLYCFDWDLTHDGEPFSAKPVRSVTAYADLLKQREALRRVFTGQTPIASILAGILRRRFHKMAAALRPGARQETIKERIVRLRGRGAELVLLYSAGDLGLADLRLQLGATPAEVAATLGEPARILDGADHILSTAKAQDELFETLLEVIERVESSQPRREHAKALP